MKLKLIRVQWLVLLLVIAFGCQTEIDVPEPQSEETRRVVSAQDIPGVVQKLQTKLGLPNYISEFSTAGGEGSVDLKIDWDQILQLVDSTGRETYTFSIEDNDQNPFNFYNLILQLNADKQAYQPFLLKYELADEFIPEYRRTRSLKNFTGQVSKIVLNETFAHNGNNSAALSPEVNLNGTVCPGGGVTYTGGIGTVGGGGWTSTPPDISDPDPSTTLECTTYLNYTEWTNADGSLNNIQFGSIEVECEERAPSGSSSDSDGACKPTIGEIPIIEPRAVWFTPEFIASKAMCIYDQLNKLGSGAGFNDLIRRFDSGFSNADLLYSLGPLDKGFNAVAKPPQNYIIEIQLNSVTLNDRTRLGLARTILHETIHAEMFRTLMMIAENRPDLDVPTSEIIAALVDSDFSIILRYYAKYGRNDWDHEQMADLYITEMGRILYEFDNHKHGLAYYEDFSWNGLHNTDAYKKLPQNRRDRIDNTIAHNKRTDSKTCESN